MAEMKIPYDQRLARACIRPFAGTALHPNVVTGISLALGTASGLSFAAGGPGMQHIAALLFMLAVFVDHMDGELARMTGKVSRVGYYLDYLVGSLNYTILFSAIGLGIYQWNGSEIALWIGLAAGLSNPIIVALRLLMERRFGSQAVEHPSGGGFELEDFIYLIGPVTWLGGLEYFFWLYATGTLGYLLWTMLTLLRKSSNA
tara:strand:+ start:37 stop:642 length:606 start_codon:yes stop_codon:yes gene_type:complete